MLSKVAALCFCVVLVGCGEADPAATAEMTMPDAGAAPRDSGSDTPPMVASKPDATAPEVAPVSAWCSSPLPANATPDCSSLDELHNGNDQVMKYACPGGASRTVPVFGALPCSVCVAAGGATIGECVSGVINQTFGDVTCQAPTTVCVLSCDKC